MTEEKTTGLLLQAIPYLSKKIIKVLTPEGLLTFITKKKALTPFLYAEWIYTKKKEIHPLHDDTLLDDLSLIKQDFARLTAAGRMAQDLLRTQLPGKPAIEALTLTLACFRKLPLFSDPSHLAAIFRLKLLISEGLLDPEDTPQLQPLLQARSFTELAALPCNTTLIDQIFEERLNL